jgi:hypothetical protein
MVRFLSRWSLATGIALVALIAAFVSRSTSETLPDDNAELEMALEHET